MGCDDAPIRHVLDDLQGGGHDDVVSVGDITGMFQHRSLGVLLTVFSLLAALPVIGGIPGMSILTGSLILIAIVQSLIGRGELWLPQSVRRREINRKKFERGIAKARPWLQWLDHLVSPRLSMLASGRVNRWIISAVAALLAITFYPMAVVPWGVTVPALGILFFGLGLMGGDGLFVLLGYAFAVGTGYMLYAFV